MSNFTDICDIWYLDNSNNIEDLVIEMNPVQSQLDQYFVPLSMATIAILILAGYLALMLTFYERFGMDTMKRGLSNRLVSSFLNFGLIGIVASFIEEFRLLFVNRHPDSRLLFGFTYVFFFIGSFLVLNQIVLWKYVTKKVIKRIPSFNHDFIGVWLEISSLVIALILTEVEAHGIKFTHRFNIKFWPFYPNI